jgi:hypothetical protein
MNTPPQKRTSYRLSFPDGRFDPILVELEDFVPLLVNGSPLFILPLPIRPLLAVQSGTVRLYYNPADCLLQYRMASLMFPTSQHLLRRSARSVTEEISYKKYEIEIIQTDHAATANQS